MLNSVSSSKPRRKGWTTDLPQITQNVSSVPTLEEFYGDMETSQIEEHFERDGTSKSANDRFSPSPNFSSISVSAARRHLPLGTEISNARQRIREKAKSMVEQRKLAKRLLIMGQAEEQSITAEDDEEIARGDTQIEQSIKLGTKYVGESQMVWSQQEEAVGIANGGDAERGEARHGTRMVTLARPVQCSAEKEAKFTAMLKWGEGGRTEGTKTQRKGTDEPSKIGVAQPSAESDHRFADQSLILWSAPLSWSRWVRQNGTRRWAGRAGTKLWLDIHRLEFDHHWLFTGAELRERTLLRSFEAFVGTHEKALKAAKEWLMEKQAEEEAVPTDEGEATRGDDNKRKRSPPIVQLDALLGNFLRVQKELTLCVNVLERAWNDADQTHGQFVLRRLEGHAEIFEEEYGGGVPEELRDFFRSPMFLLSERAASTEKHSASEAARPSENERQRKAAVIACHYQVQIFFNDLIVCASDPVPLHWPSFCVPFARIFDLRVFERPEKIRIRLMERLSRMAKWQEIAEVFVPLLADHKTGTSAGDSRKEEGSLVGLQFASTVHRGSFKDSLGCGGQAPFMQGRIFCALKSISGKSGEKNEERKEQSEKVAANICRPLFPSLFPRRAILCSSQILSSDLRLNALEKRWIDWSSRPRHRIEFGHGKETKKAENESDEEQMGDTKQKGAEFGLEARKRTGREMALSLRRHLWHNSERWRRARDPAELVREEPLPTLSLFPQLLVSRRPFDISRRLKPMRRHPLLSLRRPILSEQQLSKRKLILNIQFASFIPKRFVNGGPSQIFLHLSTKVSSLSTTIVDGRHANWQETLAMEMGREKEDEREEDDCLEVDMFDVEVRPMESDDRERDTRHEREERRWLGTARVPLRALVALRKADGHLTLQSPMFHTGYRSHPSDRPITVRLLISIDPSPSFPLQAPSFSQLGQNDNLLSEGEHFENRFRQRFPNRRVLANVCSTEGKQFTASRFLRPVIPPAQIVSLFSANPKKAVSAAAQITACVPVLVDSDELVPTKTPIWSTIDEILRFGTASADELGTLLCCWLLGLHLSALLLLGSSLPDGPNSAAVYVKFPDGDRWLIIPSNGHHFDLSDSTCPFLSVGTVLSDNNVYVNLQNASHPSQLDFDLTKRANWASLFPSSALFPSVQPETVNYGETDENQLMELRTNLERDIRLHFDQARPFAIPQWNLLGSRILREVLIDSLGSSPDSVTSVSLPLDIEPRLEQLKPAFRLSALAFRFPFFSRAQIVRQVLRSQVHLNSEPQAQFALALHFQPMVGDAVLGCAVAICTLLPNKQMQTQ
ncbi:hypothetical protein niasHT_027571 [Heterodera trifolii]|uniref:C2 domain-containing protein n=1 Tax=Heterodera trifolii TaxID=157864 RepID=A0ABD2K556_9BILA